MTLPAAKHHWKFDEGSGQVALDAIGGAKMVIDREDWRSGRQDTGLRFNPADGARVVTSNLPELLPSWTAAFWVLREADTEAATLLSSDAYALKLEQWRNLHTLGITRFGDKDESINYMTPLNQWTHLTFVGDVSSTKVYVNGVLQDTIARSINLALQWLGSSGGWIEFASMILDDMQIFDVALDAAQVAELYGLLPKRNPKLTVSVNGQEVQSGGTLDLGAVPLDQVKATDIVIKNSGDGRLTYSLQGSDASGQFSLTNAAGQTLEAGASVTSAVQYRASQSGRGSITLTITSNDPQIASFTYTITATGEAASVPQLQVRVNGQLVVQGGSYDLGNVDLQQRLSGSLTVQNGGAGTLTYSFGGFDGSGMFSWPSVYNANLAASASAQYPLGFRADMPGQQFATVIITSNDPALGKLEFRLTASGNTAAQPKLEIMWQRATAIQAGGTYDMGPAKCGDRTYSVIAIRNRGAANLVVTLEVADPSGMFQISNILTRNVNIAPDSGGGYYPEVSFASKVGATVIRGRQSTQITVRSNDPERPVLTFNVTATSLC